MAATHPASCRCADCRARRAVRAVDQGMNPSSHAAAVPLKTAEELEQEERERQAAELEAFIAQVRGDPLAYVVNSRDEGTSFDDIGGGLIIAGFDAVDIAALMEEARLTLNRTRLRRGLLKMAVGVVMAGAGVGLSYGLSSLLSGWIVAFWVLVLAGVVGVGQGVWTMFKKEK